MPDSLGTLTSLSILNLRDTQIEGTIPESLGRLTSLSQLLLCEFGKFGSANSLSPSKFSCELPGVFHRSEMLMSFLAIFLRPDDTHLSGTIPEVLDRLTSLSDLRLCESGLFRC